VNNTAELEMNKARARTFYEGARRGDVTDFLAVAKDAFTLTAPAYLPWGGTHRGKDKFLIILPVVGKYVDFERAVIDSVTADENRVVVVFRLGVAGSTAMFRLSDHWEFEDGFVSSMWFAIFEPEALLSQIQASTPAIA